MPFRAKSDIHCRAMPFRRKPKSYAAMPFPPEPKILCRSMPFRRKPKSYAAIPRLRRQLPPLGVATTLGEHMQPRPAQGILLPPCNAYLSLAGGWGVGNFSPRISRYTFTQRYCIIQYRGKRLKMYLKFLLDLRLCRLPAFGHSVQQSGVASLGGAACARPIGVTLRGGWLPAKLGYSGTGSYTVGQYRTVRHRPNFRPPGPEILCRSMPFRRKPKSYAAMPFPPEPKILCRSMPFRRKPKSYAVKPFTFNSRALRKHTNYGFPHLR